MDLPEDIRKQIEEDPSLIIIIKVVTPDESVDLSTLIEALAVLIGVSAKKGNEFDEALNEDSLIEIKVGTDNVLVSANIGWMSSYLKAAESDGGSAIFGVGFGDSTNDKEEPSDGGVDGDVARLMREIEDELNKKGRKQ